MTKSEILAGLSYEIRRGTIVLCVLAKIRKPTYGYSLIPELTKAGITIETNTLYPLLRRLESQGLLESEWNTTDGAKPRKYYHITDLGKEVYGELKAMWRSLVESMGTLDEEEAAI